MAEALLDVQHLGVAFEGARSTVTAVDDVSFRLHRVKRSVSSANRAVASR